MPAIPRPPLHQQSTREVVGGIFVSMLMLAVLLAMVLSVLSLPLHPDIDHLGIGAWSAIVVISLIVLSLHVIMVGDIIVRVRELRRRKGDRPGL